MTFTWDFNTATLVAILAQAVLLIVFLVKTANTAKSAMQKAEEAEKHAESAHEKVAALHGIVSLHKEQVAREYIDKAALERMESRLTRSIEKIGERLDEIVDRGRN